MRKVKCVKGHFYDADKNKLCPHCGLPESGEKAETIKESSAVSRTKKEDMKTENGGVDTAILLHEEAEVEKTLSFWNNDIKISQQSENGESMTNIEKLHEKTSRDIDSLKTVSKYVEQGGNEPVTGWLVCTRGSNYGKSYEIKSGQNSIGRDSNMKLCIKEEGITREKHAFLIFEPKKRQFYLRGGDGSGLTYCNEDLVVEMVQLKAYDKVQFGDAEFVFVPLCGEQFMWTEKME